MNQHRDTESLAGASDTTGTPLADRRADEAVEMNPVVFYGKDAVPETENNWYDFTPKTEEESLGLEDVQATDIEEGADDPKGLSAPASALSEIYERVKTQLPVHLQPDASSNDPATTVDADKDSTTDEGSKTGSGDGSPTSKQPSSSGSGKRSAQNQE